MVSKYSSHASVRKIFQERSPIKLPYENCNMKEKAKVKKVIKIIYDNCNDIKNNDKKSSDNRFR